MPFPIMEDLYTRLFIADVEVSCWEDQLRQAVSISYLSILIGIHQFSSYILSINPHLVLINCSF